MLARDFYPIAAVAAHGHYWRMDGDKFVRLLNARISGDPDLTPAGLASRAGVDKSTIRKLLSGENKSPRIDTAEKICRALGTTLEAFIAGQPDPVEREIVDLYNQLSPDERRLLLAAARGLAAAAREVD